jgi:hypothetical protein
MRSAWGGVKSDFIREAVFSSSGEKISGQRRCFEKRGERGGRGTFTWSQKRVCERKCDERRDRENEVREELALSSISISS